MIVVAVSWTWVMLAVEQFVALMVLAAQVEMVLQVALVDVKAWQVEWQWKAGQVVL